MVKVAEEWLNICGGCEVTILDIGEPLLDLLPSLDFVHIPVLHDHKYHGQTGEGDVNKIDIPAADVGIISGGIRNEKEKHVAEAMRKSCKVIVSLGSCACFGGIPALANMTPLPQIFDKVYRDSVSTEKAKTPDQNLPPLTDRVLALDEVIKVDVYIPGCPTNPALVVQALTALLTGTPFKLSEKSVCDECPTKREKKGYGELKLRRPLDMAQHDEKDWSKTRCLLEQGYLCMGPVTKGGCAEAEDDGTKIPRCIKGLMPCRGCFGPVRSNSNPLVDMVDALASVGYDAKDIEDRRAMLLRYVGSQGRLKPLKEAGK